MASFRNRIPAIVFCLALWAAPGTGPAAAAQQPETLAAWEQYVEATEDRIENELGGARTEFFSYDFQAAERAAEDKRAVLEGRTIIERMKTRNPNGSDIEVPGGMIHHWRGAVFIPGVTVEEVLNAVRHPENDTLQEDVLEARVLERTDESVRVYLKLVRSRIVTATYNTEHLAVYRRHGTGRASSATIALRIAELDDAGTNREREKAPGEDRGFLWRLRSYWRYGEVDGGVVVESESISLSRSIPFLARPFVRPIVSGVAKESLDRTLSAIRMKFRDQG